MVYGLKLSTLIRIAIGVVIIKTDKGEQSGDETEIAEWDSGGGV